MYGLLILCQSACLSKSRVLNLHQCKVCQNQYFFQVLEYKSHPSMTSNRQKRTPVRRRRLQCCAGFAITDYRSQGRSFNDIILDLESSIKIAGDYRTYSAVYVALSRCQSLKDFLPQKINRSGHENRVIIFSSISADNIFYKAGCRT